MIAFMFVFSFRIEFIDFFVVFIEDGGARANLIFQAAAPDGTAFPASEVQAVAAVAIFFFINVTDDEPPFRQTQIFNKQKYEKRAEGV